MATHDVVSWNAMILGFVKCGKAQKALHLFPEMQRERVQPVAVTFIAVLNACSDLCGLEEGRCGHKVCKVVASLIAMSAIALLTCILNAGA
jgi:pentatricopeptide repeat protein